MTTTPDESADDESADDDMTELSLDNLGEAYARAAAEHDPESFSAVETETEETQDEEDADEYVDDEEEENEVATPEAIIEAALFVGHPENKSFTEQRLASLMRDVTPVSYTHLTLPTILLV